MARRKETFIITLWIDTGADDSDNRANRRGSVEHLPSHRRLYFGELVELVEFLTSVAGWERDPRE